MIVIENSFTGTVHPLTHPRVGGAALTGTVTASTEAAGYDADNAANPLTYSGWKPTAVPATWEMDFGGTATVSFMGLAGHDCGTVGATVIAETWDGAAWVVRGTIAPTDDSAILFLFHRGSHTKARFRFTGFVPTVAVMRIGDVTEFPRKANYTGSVSLEQAVRDEFSTPTSDGGHWLGRFRTRSSTAPKVAVSGLPEWWVDNVLVPLLAVMRDVPVFIADRPGSNPKSVAYAFTSGDVMAERTIANAAASHSVSFDLVGHVST